MQNAYHAAMRQRAALHAARKKPQAKAVQAPAFEVMFVVSVALAIVGAVLLTFYTF